MSAIRPKVLLLQECVFQYRIPILKIIAEQIDLEVATYSRHGSIPTDLPFLIHDLKIRRFGPFKFVPGLREMCDRFDVVITQPHLSNPDFCRVPFVRGRRYKALSWSIGTEASYTIKYSLEDPHTLKSKLYGMILKACDANIFYMPQPKARWIQAGLDPASLFVAHNTVEALPVSYSSLGRKHFLFVGTLFREKRVDLLITAWRDAYLAAGIPDDFPSLNIVGGGSIESELIALADSMGLGEKVIFHHAVFEEDRLADLFTHALLCLSPHQAGLSVLKSFAYGTPFVTRKDAATGGEILNITDGETGVLYDNDSDLVDILLDAWRHPERYYRMGQKAYDFYHSEASPEAMASGVVDAVKYALNQK